MKKTYIFSIIAVMLAASLQAQVKTSRRQQQQQVQAQAQQMQQQQTAQVQQVAQPAQQVQYVQTVQPVQQQYIQQPLQTVPAGQPVQQTVTVTGAAAVPVTTVVPVQAAPVAFVNNATVIESAGNNMTRAQRRALKAEQFAARLDSLVGSRNFVFYPNAMQEVPSGSMSNITADFYYLGIFTDTAEVHLPTVKGATEYIDMLNFDAIVSDFRLYPFQSGVSCTFTLNGEGVQYFGRLVVSSVTGETILTIVTPSTTMRYTGWLCTQKLHED